MTWWQIAIIWLSAFVIGMHATRRHRHDPVSRDIARLVAMGYGEDCIVEMVMDLHYTRTVEESVRAEVREMRGG